MTTTTEPNWLREPPAAAYGAVLDAAELCACARPEVGREVLAAGAYEVDQRWLANAGVRALARLVGGPPAAAWWAKLREESNVFTDPALQLEVIAALEVIAVAEAMERGAFARVVDVTKETQFIPADYAAIAARYIGMIVAHFDAEGICPVAEMMAKLRRACGLEEDAE